MCGAEALEGEVIRSEINIGRQTQKQSIKACAMIFRRPGFRKVLITNYSKL
jgi:hypothetical protein